MVDFLYHLLGVCGEHNHPHLINMGFLAATIYTAIRVYQKYYSYE